MSWRPNDDEGSDSEDEYEYGREFTGREAIIFVIDAFLSKTPERFQKCLNIIQEAIISGLLIKEKDLIGVVFCNTKHKPDPKDVEGINNIVVKENTAVLLPLRPLTKDIVRYYMEFVRKDTDHFDFNNAYGCTVGSFTNAIWLCTNMFKQCGTKLITSTILMFTDLDIPPDVENGDFQQAIRKASDLNQIDVDFNVIPMRDDFDYEKFYKEFICTVQDIELDEFITPNPAEERKFVSDRQLKQNFKKQCNAHLRWTLNDGLEISISMYNYYRKNVQPKSVKLLREDNSIVDVKYVWKIAPIDDEERAEERICKPGDERKVIKVGGENIVFTSDELAKMRSPLTPRITLLGFKSKSVVSTYNFIRSTSFIYPDEAVIEGSTKLFRALWEKCIEKEKVAICVLVSRRKTPPRYVALVPTTASPDDPTDYLKKDGFKVFYLPFEIDYRDIDLSEYKFPSDVDEQHIELFKKIIKKLKYKFKPTIIHDPSLQKLRADIVGLALDVEPEDEITDLTVDTEGQDAILRPFLPDLKNLFSEDQEATKRKGAGDDGKEPKVPKASEENVIEEQILRLIASKCLNQLTAKQLRAYLQSKGVSGISSAKKEILIEKIYTLHK